jgi:hypothetical protein
MLSLPVNVKMVLPISETVKPMVKPGFPWPEIAMTEGKPRRTDKSMTIKAVPIATRLKMAASATRAGETMGEFLVRAVDTQAAIDAGTQVLPPGQPDKPEVLPALVTVETADLAALLQAVAAVGAVAPSLPRSVAREAYGAARIRLREARGLPGKLVRRSRQTGQTIRANGQTFDEIWQPDIVDKDAATPGREAPPPVDPDATPGEGRELVGASIEASQP